MRINKRERAFEGKHLRLVRKFCTTSSGREYAWETVERTNIYNRGAVIIIAMTKEKEVILERNWRAPIETFVIQFPAGLTDKESESEEETARRELLEETGYLAKELIPIIATPLCPTLTPTEGNHFLALDVEYVGGERKDSAEEIEVVKVPAKGLADFLLNLPEDTRLDLRVPGILWVLEKRQMI
jgi:ADP-ribose pyrophosphatase